MLRRSAVSVLVADRPKQRLEVRVGIGAASVKRMDEARNGVRPGRHGLACGMRLRIGV